MPGAVKHVKDKRVKDKGDSGPRIPRIRLNGSADEAIAGKITVMGGGVGSRWNASFYS
ncbi:MAG: hypothetical protein HQK89_04985 [Nitrospirae bacterium]|nr:hypothetical protein [Nitrospirota bacterium]